MSTTTMTTSLPKVYAVFAENAEDFYARPELMKLFASEADAEAYAEKLRKVVNDGLWPGDEPVAAFSGVMVKLLSVN